MIAFFTPFSVISTAIFCVPDPVTVPQSTSFPISTVFPFTLVEPFIFTVIVALFEVSVVVLSLLVALVEIFGIINRTFTVFCFFSILFTTISIVVPSATSFP